MQVTLDAEKRVPLYRQIVDAIRHQVATGALAQGERLPTVRVLADELQIDRNTTLRAYRLLHREGVVSVQHGRGTFVRAAPQHPHMTRHREQALETLMDESIARALSLGYPSQEIERAFQKRLVKWQRTRKRTRKE